MPTFLLGQAGRFDLTNYAFVLEAPWKACRICGDICQTIQDRKAYELHLTCGHYPQATHTHQLCELFENRGREKRKQWLKRHNAQHHTPSEIEAFVKSGIEVTAAAAAKLSTYGIIHISGSCVGGLDPDEDQALLEAPRAPVNDVYSW